jgi:hypothetical protein
VTGLHPREGCELGDTFYRVVSQAGQDRAQVIARPDLDKFQSPRSDFRCTLGINSTHSRAILPNSLKWALAFFLFSGV